MNIFWCLGLINYLLPFNYFNPNKNKSNNNNYIILQVKINKKDLNEDITLFNPASGKTLASVVNGAPIEYLDIMDKFEKIFKKK